MAGTFSARAQSHSDENLPLDGEVRVGRLDNGMTYYIKHHENPKQRADFFIAHNVGALQEEDNQDGLAHFLEHMAFNGTKNFPDKNLLNYLASIGVRFGYNVNAYTSRDRTVYNVSNVPLVRESIVDSLLLIMHDWSCYISCEAEEIEAERGVIREEWRRGYNVRTRMALRTAEFEYAGSKYAERDVIGNPNIINTFERATLVDFYHKWYRPDMQAIIVVGDVDVDAMEAKIRKVMSTIPKVVNPIPKEHYTIPESDKPRFCMITDPETGAIGVKLVYLQPYPAPEERDDVATLSNELARKVFLEMVRARLVETEKQPDSPYKRIVAVVGSQVTCNNTLQLTALPQGEKMREALVGALVDVERIRRYGFSEREFELARTKVIRAEINAIDKFSRADNAEMAGVYVEHFTRNVPYVTAEERKRATQEQLGELTIEQVDALKEEMTIARNMLVMILSPEKHTDKVPSEATIFSLIDSVSQAKIAPPQSAQQAVEPLFAQEPIPGKVVKTQKGPFESVEWTLSNGAKVLWRTIPEVSGMYKISMQAHNEGGYARDSDVEALRLLQDYVSSMGVKEFDRGQMRELCQANRTSMMCNLDKNAVRFRGSVTLENSEFLFQLMNLYLSQPNFSAENYGKFIALYREKLIKERSPYDIHKDSSILRKYGAHPWSNRATLATLDRFDAQAAQALYTKLCGNIADYVFVFAGEMPVEEAKLLVEKYIGSLPAAPRQKYSEVDFEIVPGVVDYEYITHKAVTPKSGIERIYHGKFKCTAENYATLRYVTYILGSRYMTRVREEKGGTYYIGVQNEISVRPYGYCHLIVDFDTEPGLSSMLLAEVQKGIEELAAEPPTEQEVLEARLYFQKANAEKQESNPKNPTFYIDKIFSQQIYGIDWRKDDVELISSVTPGQIRRLTQEILSQGNRFTTIFTQQNPE